MYFLFFFFVILFNQDSANSANENDLLQVYNLIVIMQSSSEMITQVARRSLLRSFTLRRYGSGSIKISDFSTTKKGTGAGPFVELPEFKQLQDSLLIKLPSSCTVYGNLDKISAITSDGLENGKPFLAQDYDSTRGLSMVTTGDHAANVLVASYTPLSNVVVLEMDNYEEGFCIPNFSQEALCLSGDLHLDNTGHLRGHGVVALAGQGPVYQMILKKGESIVVAVESLLAHNENIQLQLTKLNSSFSIPQRINDWLLKNASDVYEKLLIQWIRLFSKDKIYYEIQGPGIVLLQTNFVPGSKTYSRAELLKVSQ